MKISKTSGVPYSTVYDVIHGRVEIDRVRIGIAAAIANACELSLDNFYRICKASQGDIVENVIIKNHTYYLKHMDGGEEKLFRLCTVNDTNKNMLQDYIRLELLRIELEKASMEVREWHSSDTKF